jgi:hypothetical protein
VEHRRRRYGGAVQRGGRQKLKNYLFNLLGKKTKKIWETETKKLFVLIYLAKEQKKIGNDVRKMFYAKSILFKKF